MFNAKSNLIEPLWYYLTDSQKEKGVYNFSKGFFFYPKVNALTQLELELDYYTFTIQEVNNYTTWTPKRIPFTVNSTSQMRGWAVYNRPNK